MSQNTAADRLKKVMRIALVGIRPADQVILKGYLRILLRLEADLEWVSANHPQIDLFMINSEFQHAESVQRLLSGKPDSAVLYVSRSETEDGHIDGNLLTLPLKDLEPLNQWFFQHLNFLSMHQVPATQKPSTQTTAPTTHESQRRQSVDDILANRAAQGSQASPTTTQPSNSVTQPSAEHTALLSIAKVILQLQRREDQLLTLTDTQGVTLAYIQPKQHRVWPVSNNIGLSTGWVLSADNAPSVNVAQSQDLVQWLWQLAMTHSPMLKAFIHPQQRYHLTSWVKPSEGQARHEYLKCQCVLEARPVTLTELAASAQVTEDIAQTTILGLLLSGVMSIEVYKNLPAIVKQAQTASIDNSAITAQPAVTPAAPISQASQSVSNEVAASQSDNDTGMKSFLSRLRRKLGI